ncbi:MAG: GTPase Era, partial [Rhodospirillaceae bacterium]|nr:GTPase Era [Rhodospirillaceae bacterium]
ETRCGFVALVGAPDAGKSTLLNRLVGEKVSIVSPKVQTTRTQIRGICVRGDAQVIFVDTPGIFEPRRRLDRAMVDAAWRGAGDADLVVLLIDVSRKTIGADARRIIDGLKTAGRQAILAMNKVDLVKREDLLPRTAELNATGIFTDTFMISAENGSGCDDLLAHLAERMASGPWLYPEDEISDLPERLLAAEVTREQVYNQLHQELPYAITVETDRWEEKDDGSARIEQTVYVQRDSQKMIVLGKRGQQIKAIGAAARAELERLLDRRMHLFLHVKVRENWVDDPERYRDWGLDWKA